MLLMKETQSQSDAGVDFVIVLRAEPDVSRKAGFPAAGELASLNRSWQSKEGTYRALGMAGIEPTPSKSECDWTLLSPLTTCSKGLSQ